MRTSRTLARGGFSLLEVVVAMTLGMVLLGAVWTMFNLLTRRQAVELRQADRNQVTRALHQRMSRDLKSLLSILEQRPRMRLQGPQEMAFRRGAPMFPLPLPDVSPVEWETPVVFVGRKTKLIVQVFIEPVETESLMTYQFPSTRSKRGDKPAEQIPVTKFICYEAGVEHHHDKTNELDSPPSIAGSSSFEESPLLIGLTRSEYLQLPPEELEVNQGAQADEPNRTQRLNRHENSEADPEPKEEEPDQQNVPYLVETIDDIADLELAYYDGQAWTGNWDSRTSNQLPVAVRMRYRFLTKAELAEVQSATNEDEVTNAIRESTPDEARDSEEELLNSEPAEEEKPVFDVEYVFLVKVRPVDRNANPVSQNFGDEKKSKETTRRRQLERLP